MLFEEAKIVGTLIQGDEEGMPATIGFDGTPKQVMAGLICVKSWITPPGL